MMRRQRVRTSTAARVSRSRRRDAGILGSLVVVAVAMATAGPAQPNAGQHRGFLVSMLNGAIGTSHVLQLTAQNTGTVYSTNPAGAWTFWGNSFGVAHDPDNRHLVLPGIVPGSGRIGLARWDPTKPGVTSTLWSGPFGTPLMNWSDLVADPDGEYVTIDNLASPQTLSFFDPATSSWRAEPLPATVGPAGGTGGIAWDRLGGGFVYSAWGGAVGTITLPSAVFRADYRGRNTTLVTAHSKMVQLPAYGGDLLQTGDWISSSRLTTVMYYVAKPGGTFASGPSAGAAGWDVTAEHFAKPGIGAWVASGTAPYGIFHVDLTPATPVVTGVFTGSPSTMPTAPCEVASLYTNDLATVRTGGRTWDLRLNPGLASFANRPYVIGVSLAGATRIPLPDGREAFLTPDNAFGLSVNNQLAPFIRNTVGQLDATGKATCTIDLSALGTSPNGLIVHFAAIVIDPAAPSGIAHVCQPWAFVVDNR